MALLLEPNQVYPEIVVRRERAESRGPWNTQWLSLIQTHCRNAGLLPYQHRALYHVRAPLAADGLHNNLDTVSILILWNCHSEKSSAWTKITWQLISRDFYHSYLVGITRPQEGPQSVLKEDSGQRYGCPRKVAWVNWTSLRGKGRVLSQTDGKASAYNLCVEMSAYVNRGEHSHSGVNKWQHIQVLWRTQIVGSLYTY